MYFINKNWHIIISPFIIISPYSIRKNKTDPMDIFFNCFMFYFFFFVVKKYIKR